LQPEKLMLAGGDPVEEFRALCKVWNSACCLMSRNWSSWIQLHVPL